MEPRLFKTASAWRAWLARNGGRAKEIWLAYYKKGTGKRSVTYSEALDEALCFGWIDSTIRRLDDERYMQRWTPRHPTSIWSQANKARISRLTAEGRMAEPGSASVRTARRNGSWAKLDDIDRIDRDRIASEEVVRLLETRPDLAARLATLSASKRKMLSYWIADAKRPETRARRIAELPDIIATGRTPGFKA
jgi:uncharacterized protein YdeI (YjbR/CyaY-like superfamily)